MQPGCLKSLPLHVQVARQHLQPDVGPWLLTNVAPHMRGMPAVPGATPEEARQAFLHARGCRPPADTQVQRLTGDPFALFLLLAAVGCDSVNGREGHAALGRRSPQPDVAGPTLSQAGCAGQASSHSAAQTNRDGSEAGMPGGQAAGVAGSGGSSHCQAQHTQTGGSAGQDGLQAFAEMLQARFHAVACLVGLVFKCAGKQAHAAKHQPDCLHWSCKSDRAGRQAHTARQLEHLNAFERRSLSFQEVLIMSLAQDEAKAAHTLCTA